MTRPIRLVLLPVAVLVLCTALAIGCGDDSDDPANAWQNQEDASAEDSSQTIEVEFQEPCIGQASDPSAEIYNSECEGIEVCTEMPEGEGSCWCALCGPKGAKTVCLQAFCKVPGQ